MGIHVSRGRVVRPANPLLTPTHLAFAQAAIFFLFAIQEDPENVDDWAALARHRWEQYELTRGALSPLASALGAEAM